MIPYPLLSMLPLILGKAQSLLIVFQENGNFSSNELFILFYYEAKRAVWNKCEQNTKRKRE